MISDRDLNSSFILILPAIASFSTRLARYRAVSKGRLTVVAGTTPFEERFLACIITLVSDRNDLR